MNRRPKIHEDTLEDVIAFVLKEQERTDKLIEAIDTGEVCRSLGHRYHVPDQIVRDKIVRLGWKIEKRCQRCGEVDGAWAQEDWTLPQVAARFTHAWEARNAE